MNTPIIPLFVGDEIADPGERHLISRLRRDLSSRGVTATLYANFFPSAHAGQIDLVVRAQARTAHVEIKTLSADYPVFGRPNGHWEQHLLDGSRRSLGKNAAKQALEGTWAVGDAMRKFARTGAARTADFKRHIDTMVGIWQRVPAGSDIETPAHVTVVGYADLLERLAQPGPMVDWTEDEWDGFARSLALFQPASESQAERRRRAAGDPITDYRLRAQTSFSAELGPVVDLGADRPDGHVTLDELGHLVGGGTTVALVGPSGLGKSVAGLHVAVSHCSAGRLVIRVRAGEYEKGRFSNLLARSMAPFSRETWSDLVRSAPDAGVPLTVVLDGVNECPAGLRSELLEQLGAFLNRYPAGVLVTSTDDYGFADILGATILAPTAPKGPTRREVLAAHGSNQADRISMQFQTPYELAVAARCESELEDDSSLADLHAAYVRQFAPTESVRAGLRAIAVRLHERLRSSLPMLETTTVLNGEGLDLSAGVVDEVLDCRLLDVGRQRVRFRHELLGQFLAAEHLVRAAASGAALGDVLGAPANRDLASAALAIEPEASRALEALEHLADPMLFLAGLEGDYGIAVAGLVRERVRHVLLQAVDATDVARARLREDSWFGRWDTDAVWSRTQQALLAVAGHALRLGLFVDEVCELVDRTDSVCLHNAHRLKAGGSESPISAVVASTYNQVRPSDGEGLAASYVVTAFELASMGRRFARDERQAGLARRFAAVDGDRAWGRLYLACLSVDPEDPQDQAEFASLLRRAWDAGGYHLQLEALRAAEYFGGSDEPYRTAILDVVNRLHASNWAHQNSIIEVLSAFGEIDRELTAEGLREDIRDVIALGDLPESRQAASGIVSNQFEDENIVGPYSEAIDGLTSEERIRLLAMAAKGSDLTMSMFLDWTLDELSQLVPTGDPSLDAMAKAAFGTLLLGPPSDAVMPTEATSACLSAIRGWAKFDNALPDPVSELNDDQRSWRLVADLLLHFEREDAASAPGETWRQLHQDRPQAVLTLSTLEGAAYRQPPEGRRHALQQLYEAHTTELRNLFEWALDHPELLPMQQVRRRGGPDHFVIRALGHVGDLGTVERLRVYTLDPDPGVGSEAVAAIRRIHQRHQI